MARAETGVTAPYSDEIVAEALALYLELRSSRKVARILAAKYERAPDYQSILRWAAAEGSFAPALRQEQEEELRQRWVNVAHGALDIVEKHLEEIPPSQAAIVAGIGTDKVAKLGEMRTSVNINVKKGQFIIGIKE